MYLTPKQCVGQQCGEWIEIAYGTNRGMVRIIFQHPETVGQGKLTNLTVFNENFSFNNKLSIYSICKMFSIFNVIKIITSVRLDTPVINKEINVSESVSLGKLGLVLGLAVRVLVRPFLSAAKP